MSAPLPWEVAGFAPPLGYDITKESEGYYFDEAEADKREKFFLKCLVYTEGEWAGRPFDLSVPGLEWERWIVRNLFGWKNKETGARRFRTLFLYIPRKNGKTTFAAALLLCVMYLDNEPAAQLFSVATDKKQGSLVYKHVCRMIKAKPQLSRRVKITKSQGRIEKGDLEYEVLAGDPEGKHGLSPHFYTCDELHEQQNSDYLDILETAVGARRQSLAIYMTTADFDKVSPCNEMLDYAMKVAKGIIPDPTQMPVVFRAERPENEKDNPDWWTDEECWALANPNYRNTLKVEYMRGQCEKAKQSHSKKMRFLRLNLNVQTKQINQWLKLMNWDACGDFDPGSLQGAMCHGGLDLASTTDISAWVKFFPYEDKAIECHFWVPEAKAKDNDDASPNASLYRQWADEGFLTLTPGNVTDYGLIIDQIVEDDGNFNLIDIGYDPKEATHLATKLFDDHGIQMFKVNQGYAHLSEPSKAMEADVVASRLKHNANPVLRWMASNVCVKSDGAGHIRPVKPLVGKASNQRHDMGPQKIDGILALVMAYARFINSDGETIYNQPGEGLFVLGDDNDDDEVFFNEW